MLQITEYDFNNNYRVLKNEPGLFHTALKCVLKGEKRFHVEEGEQRFDLIYHDNDHMAKHDPGFPDSDFYYSETFFPPYFFYDENDTEKINLYLLDGFDEIFFEECNEYSAVITLLATKHRHMSVSSSDNRFNLFPWLKDKVSFRDKPQSDKAIYVQRGFYGYFSVVDHYCTTGLFHCLFILQWLSDLPLAKLKYLSFTTRKTEGIGSILSTYSLLSQAYGRYGIKVYLEPGCSRFSDELLSKYFVFGDVPEDSSEENTAYARSFNTLLLNHVIDRLEVKTSLDMLQPSFIAEMKDYCDQVFQNRKILGVLLRGTDYILANFSGTWYPADIDDCIKIINERVKQYDYEKIFVATEDSYFLERMISAFPNKVLAVSQKRYSVSDFTDSRYYSELEKKLFQGEAYSASVEDTTVNYFYAIYMLSQCESLISNCMCSGYSIARAFNEGKYVRTELIPELISQNSQDS